MSSHTVSTSTSTNMSAMRSFVCSKLLTVFDKREVVTNIEKSLYNWSIITAKGRGYVLNWKNPQFRHVYKQKWICMWYNLSHPDNIVIRDDINCGKIGNLKRISWLPPERMWPNGPWSSVMQVVKEKQAAKENADKLGADYEGMIECKNCVYQNKSRPDEERVSTKKTTYYQLQTRSADEPMTTFVTCHECGKHWKF